jgi:hypothetical protein
VTPAQRNAWGKALPIAFAHGLEQTRKVYEREVERLADVYRDRILAGEFTGSEHNGPRWIRLEDEIAKRHPMCRTVAVAMGVLSVSPWTLSAGSNVELSELRIVKLSAAECLTADTLRVARERGWVGSRGRNYPVRRRAS